MPLMKLGIDEIDQKQLSWDDFITTIHELEVKARIYENEHPDLSSPRGKQLLILVSKESWQ